MCSAGCWFCAVDWREREKRVSLRLCSLYLTVAMVSKRQNSVWMCNGGVSKRTAGVTALLLCLSFTATIILLPDHCVGVRCRLLTVNPRLLRAIEHGAAPLRGSSCQLPFQFFWLGGTSSDTQRDEQETDVQRRNGILRMEIGYVVPGGAGGGIAIMRSSLFSFEKEKNKLVYK